MAKLFGTLHLKKQQYALETEQCSLIPGMNNILSLFRINSLSSTIKYIHRNNGTELSEAYVPEQNGMSQHKNRINKITCTGMFLVSPQSVLQQSDPTSPVHGTMSKITQSQSLQIFGKYTNSEQVGSTLETSDLLRLHKQLPIV